jgi:hypothetical protein
MEGFLDQTVNIKIYRFITGQTQETIQSITLGPLPSWFTVYELKMALWNSPDLRLENGSRNPIFAPPLVFLGKPTETGYDPIEIVWKNITSSSKAKDMVQSEVYQLINPLERVQGPPDERFVDSAGGQKAIGKDNRVRMTLDDIFELSKGKEIPEIHAFLYCDLIDRIPGPRPLGDRDIFGRIVPYFPFLDTAKLPAADGIIAGSEQALTFQANQTDMALQQIQYLESVLQDPSLEGTLLIPKLEGVKLLRWVWDQTPEGWEGAAVFFFGQRVTHDMPFMRFFPAAGQPLTKIRVRSEVLPIPDLPDPNLLMSWKNDKNPDSGKDCTYMKIRIQESDSIDDSSIFSTMRVFNDGTADLTILPPKKTRNLDPLSDLQDTPEVLNRSFSQMPFVGLTPKLANASVVFKIRMKREDAAVNKAAIKSRLKIFASVFQEIPPLPNEQPLAMLRYKGVSNFTNETRVFAFLTQNSEREMVAGEMDEENLTKRVSEEFKISMDEARKQIIAWMSQRSEFALAVSDSKDYILSKNPGVDIAVFEQHPTYNFHIYSDQDAKTYKTIVNLLSLLITAPANRFAQAAAQKVSMPLQPLAPATAPAAPTQTVADEEEEEEFAFHNDDDEVADFVKQSIAGTMAMPMAQDEEEDFSFGNDDEGVADFVKQTMAAQAATAPSLMPSSASVVTATQVPAAVEEKEDKEVAKAFEKPKDVGAINLANYYIQRLKLADPTIFNYEKQGTERGYVSHCAANESRQPIVLDKDEYKEMRDLYDDDDDLEFILHPDDTDSKIIAKRRQPSESDNDKGALDGRPFPSAADKETVTLVKYGSKSKRIQYYFCPRLFCIRDRLMVRYKDFKSDQNRFKKDAQGRMQKKDPQSCPFCEGTLITKDDIKSKTRSSDKTILQRKTRPGSDSERNIYIGFLPRKTPAGLSLPCCFATTDNNLKADDPEFVRLGLRSAKVSTVATVLSKPAVTAKPAVLSAIGENAENTFDEDNEEPAMAQEIADTIQGTLPTTVDKGTAGLTGKYEPNYYRVIQAASVVRIIDSSRIPLKIVEPTKPGDPKAGPQIGLLPEAIDKYFFQDSTSDKFAERLDIVSKLKPTAQGFLRLGIDNSNRELSFLAAVAPFFYQPTAEKVIENIIEPIETRIPPKKFLQLNGGNLVHEFFNRCQKKHTNEMRDWVSRHLGIDELKSSNIPAIERLMNSYECFKDYIMDPTQRKDARVFFNAFSDPKVMPPRGIIFIILEATVEEVSVRKGDRVEFKKEVLLFNIRCPPYPISQDQQKADIGFIVHYNKITRDRYKRDQKTYSHLGWDPLFYVDGNMPTAESRHKPTLFFQRSQEATWPPIVQRRVSEFFSRCNAVNRGAFTSQFGFYPNALIPAQDLVTAIRIQPAGIIRDAYNHLVGIGYRLPGNKKTGRASTIVAVPVADDGSMFFESRLFFDWDDFDPAPADALIGFYKTHINGIFPQYRGYIPLEVRKSQDTDQIIGVGLTNSFVVPAISPIDPSEIADLPSRNINELEWDINNTIAYDSEMRQLAFEDANKNPEEGDVPIVDPKAIEYLKLKLEDKQDEIEDVYQHLRLTFSTWLATGAGLEKRERLKEILKFKDLPLSDKRKRLDILLYNDIIRWLEPKQTDEKSDIGFLRIDCQIQGQEDCKGRCSWVPKVSDGDGCGPCKIHTPKGADGVIMNVPRMLYLRLVDELIRYAAKRKEIFDEQVPRLTIRREAQISGDQYIIPEGSADWNSWWEMLRVEWMTPEKEDKKFFDEQYEPIPSGIPSDDHRTLPASLKAALGADDPKVDRLVWNPSIIEGKPFWFLKEVLRFNPIVFKAEKSLDVSELREIGKAGSTQVLWMPSGAIAGSLRTKTVGAMSAIIMAMVDGNVGWVCERGSYGVKIPLNALPESLNAFRLV